MKKKVLVTAVAACAALSMVACGGKSETTATTTVAETTAEETVVETETATEESTESSIDDTYVEPDYVLNEDILKESGFTFEKFYEANRPVNVLEGHENVIITSKSTAGDKERYLHGMYSKNEAGNVEVSATYTDSNDEEGFLRFAYDENGTMLFGQLINGTKIIGIGLSDANQNEIMPNMVNIQQSYMDGSSPEIVGFGRDRDAYTVDIKGSESGADHVVTSYVIEPETFKVISLREHIHMDDGTVGDTLITIEYDGEPIDLASINETLYGGENTANVTYHFNDKDITVKVNVDGSNVGVYPVVDGLQYVVYKDAALTEVVTESIEMITEDTERWIVVNATDETEAAETETTVEETETTTEETETTVETEASTEESTEDDKPDETSEASEVETKAE